jgi:hypothetical protein
LKSALDGTETLGTPSIPIASGTGVVSAGVGLYPDLDGTLNVTVPTGATVKQAILYWEGQHVEARQAYGDGEIRVDGQLVTGTRIGGPTLFYDVYSSTTYRADITNLVSDGANALAITEMDFDDKNSGAGILVIYEESGQATKTIVVKDGNDLAFQDFAAPLDACVPQDFTFGSASTARTGTVHFFFGSIQQELPTGSCRPSILEWAIDDVDQPDVCDPFSTPVDGEEWCTCAQPITVPAGATKLTFEPVSGKCLSSPCAGIPQSFAWVAAAFVIEEERGEGCTPGYWKVPVHACKWPATGYDPNANFNSTFGVSFHGGTVTLLQAAWMGGGGYVALGRHAVAALLNAAHPDVDYGMSEADVKAAVQAAETSGDPNTYKDQLEYYNEMGCPLNNCPKDRPGRGNASE